jgi:hypothetical protein
MRNNLMVRKYEIFLYTMEVKEPLPKCVTVPVVTTDFGVDLRETIDTLSEDNTERRINHSGY